jgi:NAD(P)-dependent dehydrogenase (short-subunit alcohol dehydrogenase family)
LREGASSGLANRVALVTGAASGIGREAALAFARAGARVLAVDVAVDAGRETAERIRAAGGEARFLEADVSDERAVEAMLAFAVASFGRLDCALNNAGVSDRAGPFAELSLEAWNRMLQANLTSVFLCMKHEIRQMLRQEPRAALRGAIVNTSSGAGLIAAPGLPHYTAAKHGVLGLTKVAARELGAQGIRVNAVCPGLTDTPMVRRFFAETPEIAESTLATLPGGELGRPEDVAAAAVWLCSPEARWVSGVSLLVDGGGLSL